MTHECEDCGKMFETLSALRLHDCSGSKLADINTGNNVRIKQLEEFLEQIENGNFNALHQAVATYSASLETALTEQDDNNTYRGVFWEYYEPLANGLDNATNAEGWEFLHQFVEMYDPSTTNEIQRGSPVIETAVSRHIIRTRWQDDIESVPVEALNYLESIVVEAGEEHDVEREEAHPYGWGIGHPDHAVADRLHEHAAQDIFFVNGALEHAFYADQYAAIDVLERIIFDETIQQTLAYPTGNISEGRLLLDAVAGAASETFWPRIPRYWDWKAEFDYHFKLAGEVEHRLRTLVSEADIEHELPDEWMVEDLVL